MANVKISELPAITTPTTSDLVPVVQSGSTDKITRGNFLKNIDADATLTDITTNDASTSKHGFLKKLDNNAAHFMDGQGNWSSLPAVDAGAVTYTPSDNTKWNSSSDPGDTDDALNQLASRVKSLETGGSGYTDEQAQDAVGGILDDGGDIDFTYDDATPKITASIKTTASPTVAKLTMTVGADIAIDRTTLSGTLTLTTSSKRYQSLDPDGSARNVDLPTAAAGLAFFIVNRGDGAETITVRNASAATVETIDNGEAVSCICDGTAWIAVKGSVTVV